MSNNPAAEEPRDEALARAIATVTLDLRPVRTLPSDPVLMGVASLLFIAFSLAVALTLGLAGFQQLSLAQRWIYYSTVLGCSAVIAVALIPQMIPGSKRRLAAIPALALPLVATAICAVVIFPHAETDQFVAFGLPCLRAGLLCAAGSGAIAFFLLRHGFFVNPLQAYALSATFAGFTGVAMLALHCPRQNWLHVVIWHLGAPVLAGLAALLWWRIQFIFDRS